MKHAFAQTALAIPYPRDDIPVVDRESFMTALFAVHIEQITGTPTKSCLEVSLQHSDTEDGTFEDVSDPVKYIGAAPREVAAGYVYNQDIDLLACKRFIKVAGKITFDGGTNPSAVLSCALVLGDKTSQPV